MKRDQPTETYSKIREAKVKNRFGKSGEGTPVTRASEQWSRGRLFEESSRLEKIVKKKEGGLGLGSFVLPKLQEKEEGDAVGKRGRLC